MADSAVAVSAGTGTNIDTRTEGTNGNHRQVIVVGDPATNAGVAPVDATAGLKVDLGADNDVTVTGTVDLGATDNAVLDAIAADTGTIAGDTTSIDAKIPALGQALAAASVPVVLPAAQITTLTPPAAITGFATSAKQDTIIGHVDGVETLLGTIDADTSTLAGAVAGTEMQVDVVSSALPTGASTAAKQPALGTAGTASTDVLTVQGIASMTALKVDGSAVTQPVSGTVTANLSATDNAVLDDIAADTEAIKTSLAGTLTVTGGGGGVEYTEGDTDASITGSVAMMEVGSDTVQPIQGTVAGGLLVNLGSNNDVTVTGTVDLGATDNAVLDTIDAVLDTINAKLVTGTDIGDVTINNSTGAAAVNIQDGGNSITVDGSLTVDLGANNDVTVTSGSITETNSGAIKTALETAGGLLVNLGANNDVTVTGSVTADLGANNDVTITSGTITAVTAITNALPAGTNAIGKTGHDITGIGHGVTTVTTAGTDVALAASTVCKKVIIQSQTDNTGLISIGTSGVDATIATGTGVLLYPGDAIEIEIDNLADVYLDSTVNGEGVRYTYFT